MPARIAARGERSRTGSPSRVTSPVVNGDTPKRARASADRPEPCRPPTPSTSPARSSRSTSAQLPVVPGADGEPDRPPVVRAGPVRVVAGQFPADHVPHQLVRAGVRGGHRGHPAAVLQNGDPAGQVEDLGEPVRDVQQPDAPLLEPAHQPVEQLDLVVGQRRGRLVHDEQPRVQGERLGDLDDLLLGDAQPAHPGVGRQRGLPDRGEQLPGTAEHLPPVDQPAADRLVSQVDVLRDGALRAAG